MIRAWLLPAFERAGKTAMQTFVALTTVSGVFDLAAVSWTAVGVATLSAAVLSLLTSVLSAGAGPSGSPSLVPDPNAAPAAPAGQERLVARANVLPPPRPPDRRGH
jgi:hypothetical protein